MRQSVAIKLIQNQQTKTVENMGRRVLITGGAGFIGSHTCLLLLEEGNELVVLDNFDNSSPEALRRVKELAASNALVQHGKRAHGWVVLDDRDVSRLPNRHLLTGISSILLKPPGADVA